MRGFDVINDQFPPQWWEFGQNFLKKVDASLTSVFVCLGGRGGGIHHNFCLFVALKLHWKFVES